MKLLVHIEQYDLVGILPSQLESLYDSFKDFLSAEKWPFVVFTEQFQALVK